MTHFASVVRVHALFSLATQSQAVAWEITLIKTILGIIPAYSIATNRGNDSKVVNHTICYVIERLT